MGTFAKAISGLTSLGAKVAGEASGHIRANKAIIEEGARGILASPNIAGVRMLARQVGFDLDSMIEEHGATETLLGLTQLLGMMGIDIQKVLSGGLKSVLPGQNLNIPGRTVNQNVEEVRQ